MSQPSSKVLTRQWKIIQFLLEETYVTTADIENHLYQQGIETAQRTIQRDLNLLEKIFPLECRRDCMPHNWRWKKIETVVKGLTLSQAAILLLVNKELRDVLPPHMLTELSPLFEKARLITSDTVMQNKEQSIIDILNPPSGNFDVIQPSVFGQLINHLSGKVNEIYRDALNLDEKEAKNLLAQLAVVLETHELPEFAHALKI